MLQQIDTNEMMKSNEYNAIHTPLKQTLSKLYNTFPQKKRMDLGPYVHWQNNSISPMHRWFRYREAYSPDLIDKLELGNNILDPFSGCGSILVGAAVRQKKSVGIDLNPLATFSTKVKLTPLTKSQLIKVKNFELSLEEIVRNGQRWPLPQLSISLKVFEPEILLILQTIRKAIEEFTDKDIRDFLLMAWISILESVGSYYKEGNGIKYRNKKRQKGHYENRLEGEWQRERFGPDQKSFVINKYRDQLKIMIDDSILWEKGNWGDQKIIEGSAFNLENLCNSSNFDSIIFSPPYANRFDYFESFKVELWFGGFVNSYQEMNTLRKASLCSHLGADLAKSYVQIEELESLIELMDQSASSWRMGVADLLRGYFNDMFLVLNQCRKVLPNGKCYIVVGNSAFAGIIIPTDALTAIVANKAGFRSAELIETRHLTVAPQQRNKLHGFESYMRETIVVLK